MNLDLNPEDKAAWRDGHKYFTPVRGNALKDALQRTLARALKAEFERDHKIIRVDGTHDRQWCIGCEQYLAQSDPRHNYTDEQWMEEARRVLNA